LGGFFYANPGTLFTLQYVILEKHSFPMSAEKHFYDNPLSIYLDPKIVLIYRPHPVCKNVEKIAIFSVEPDSAGSRMEELGQLWNELFFLLSRPRHFNTMST
jgi:hypothetical protein